MLRQRLITSAIGIPLLIVCVWAGNPWFTGAVGILLAFAGFEFYRIASHLQFKPLAYFGILVIVLLIFSSYFTDQSGKLLIITGATIVSLVWVLLRPKQENAFNSWAWTMGGILYIGLLFSYWQDIRNLENGMLWIFVSALAIIACDTTAFFIGRTWGKHRMAPSISPNKTWEGAIAGLAASIFATVVLGIAFKIFISLDIDYWQMVVLGIIIGVFSQVGDFIESLLKRNGGVKDSGKFFPGHGGVLDRIDSFTLVGACMFFFISYFIQ
jgi:phosphatidate cytidylyltransferase